MNDDQEVMMNADEQEALRTADREGYLLTCYLWSDVAARLEKAGLVSRLIEGLPKVDPSLVWPKLTEQGREMSQRLPDGC